MDRMQSYRQTLLKRKTPSELKIEKIFMSLKVKFVSQKIFITSQVNCIADIFIPKLNIVFEVDGKYHNNDFVFIRDVKKEVSLFRERKIEVFRFMNEDILNHSKDVKHDILIIVWNKIFGRTVGQTSPCGLSRKLFDGQTEQEQYINCFNFVKKYVEIKGTRLKEKEIKIIKLMLKQSELEKRVGAIC